MHLPHEYLNLTLKDETELTKTLHFLCYMFVLDVTSYHFPLMKAEVSAEMSGF